MSNLGYAPQNDGLYGDDLDGRSGWRRFLRPALRFVIALVGLLVLDAVWMQLIAPLLGIQYFDTVETIQGSPMAKRWVAAVWAYLVLGYAAAFLTAAPTPEEAAAKGAQIGFVIYSVFDATSTFMYSAWTLKIAVLDTVWGTLLYTILGYGLTWLETTSLWERF